MDELTATLGWSVGEPNQAVLEMYAPLNAAGGLDMESLAAFPNVQTPPRIETPKLEANALSSAVTANQEAMLAQNVAAFQQPNVATAEHFVQSVAAAQPADNPPTHSESSTLPGDISDARTDFIAPDDAISVATAANLTDSPNMNNHACAEETSTGGRRPTKEEEREMYEKGLLSDLSGTTAARSRKMTQNERDVMLHKRRLRNRASAARSREKQRTTISLLTAENDRLKFGHQKLQRDLDAARIEIQRLREQMEFMRGGTLCHRPL